MTDKIRLFVAVDLDDAVNAAIDRAIAKTVSSAPDAKWVSPDSTHLTLAFLGWTAPDRALAFMAAMEAVARAHPPLKLEVRGSGTFGAQDRPRVLWLGLEGEVSALSSLQADVVEAFVPLGYEPEKRAFSPHLTLARSRAHGGDPNLAECARSLSDMILGPSRIDAITLYKSELSREGARYTPVGKRALEGIHARRK